MRETERARAAVVTRATDAYRQAKDGLLEELSLEAVRAGDAGRAEAAMREHVRGFEVAVRAVLQTGRSSPDVAD